MLPDVEDSQANEPKPDEDEESDDTQNPEESDLVAKPEEQKKVADNRNVTADERLFRVTGAPLPRWRSRLLLTARPRHLLGGSVPRPYEDKPRRQLLPPDIDDPQI